MHQNRQLRSLWTLYTCPVESLHANKLRAILITHTFPIQSSFYLLVNHLLSLVAALNPQKNTINWQEERGKCYKLYKNVFVISWETTRHPQPHAGPPRLRFSAGPPAPDIFRFFTIAGPPPNDPGVAAVPRDSDARGPDFFTPFLRSSLSAASISSFSFSTKRIRVSQRRASSCIEHRA